MWFLSKIACRAPCCQARWARSLFFAAIVIAYSAFYLLSIGPAALVAHWGYLKPKSVSLAYRPLLVLYWRCPEIITDPFEFYLEMWSDETKTDIIGQHSLWETGADQIDSDIAREGLY